MPEWLNREKFSSDTPMEVVVVRVGEIADRQWGVVRRAQLEECGLGADAIARWVRQRRLRRLHPGVYALGHRAPVWHGHLAAALFYCGPRAALSPATAARRWGLLGHGGRGRRLDSGREAVDVIAPGRHRPQPGVVVHRGGDFDRVRRDGLPVVPVARALRLASDHRRAGRRGRRPSTCPVEHGGGEIRTLSGLANRFTVCPGSPAPALPRERWRF